VDKVESLKRHTSLRIAIVGLGNAAWKYDLELPDLRRSHTKSIIDFPNFHLVGGVDTNPITAAMWSENFQVPVFNNVQEMLLQSKPDLVVLSVPIEQLFYNLIKILSQTSTTLVLVEKPVVASVGEYHKLLAVNEEFRNRVLVNLPRLYAPEVMELSSFINTNAPSILEIQGTYSGSVLNTSLHFLTLIDYLVPGVEWNCVDSHDFKLARISNETEVVLGHMTHNLTSKTSTFDFTLKADQLSIAYLDGGNEIVINFRGEYRTIATTRDVYQQNVYAYLSRFGFDNAKAISGLDQILSSIEGMLTNYESP
jgi:hypothetical protein